MTTNKRPKCRSQVIPCPAGDRCPEHRGLVKAIAEAAQGQDLGKYLSLKDEEASKEELARKRAFLDGVRIKTNRKGEAVVTIPNPEVVFAKTFRGDGLRTTELTVTKDHKQKLIVPLPHPADAVDKEDCIRAASMYNGPERLTQDQAMQQSLDEIYDGNVQIETKVGGSRVVVDKLDVAEDYRGRGVEAHVLGSIVLDRRPDLYEFYVSEKANVPYEELKKAGFEPNPYYWAGKTHEGNGITYPSREELDVVADRDKNPNTFLTAHGHLSESKYAADLPYVRLKHGQRFSDLPLTITPERTWDERKALSAIEDKRNDAILTARSYQGKMNLS